MNGSKVLEKFTERVALSDEPAGLVEEIDDLGAFGVLRGLHERSQMISLRRKSGEIMSVCYSYIDRMAFDPSEGVTLFCGTRHIIIRGKNLNKEIRPNVSLYFGLTRWRVPWVAEADQSGILQPDKNAVVVESIEW
jgi:hypothetical protein